MKPTRAQLSKILSYDELTGTIRWCVDLPAPRGGIFIKAGSEAGGISGKGYRMLCVDRVKYYSHHIAWVLKTGRWPKNQLDHVDRDKLNNRFSNLREATNTQNQQNRNDNRSGKRGVDKLRDGKFQARITVNGDHKFLGRFPTFEAAAATRRAAEKKYYGKYCPN